MLFLQLLFLSNLSWLALAVPLQVRQGLVLTNSSLSRTTNFSSSLPNDNNTTPTLQSANALCTVARIDNATASMAPSLTPGAETSSGAPAVIPTTFVQTIALGGSTLTESLALTITIPTIPALQVDSPSATNTAISQISSKAYYTPSPLSDSYPAPMVAVTSFLVNSEGVSSFLTLGSFSSSALNPIASSDNTSLRATIVAPSTTPFALASPVASASTAQQSLQLMSGGTVASNATFSSSNSDLPTQQPLNAFTATITISTAQSMSALLPTPAPTNLNGNQTSDALAATGNQSSAVSNADSPTTSLSNSNGTSPGVGSIINMILQFIGSSSSSPNTTEHMLHAHSVRASRRNLGNSLSVDSITSVTAFVNTTTFVNKPASGHQRRDRNVIRRPGEIEWGTNPTEWMEGVSATAQARLFNA